ncbi:TPA: hydrolase [Candidatus Poribacteria bacterium]|nr:hydrolase [Candidatus Poribacteria bacterium]
MGEFLIHNGERVVFIGDSITDAGKGDDPNGLGFGYVSIIASLVTAAYPERRIHFINKGVSGNRIVELRERWWGDVIELKPNWVSISIGINDVWRRFDGRPHLAVPLNDFISIYRTLIEDTLSLTRANLILMETSVIGEDLESRPNRMLSSYNDAIRGFARHYDAILVPVNRAFRKAILSRPGFRWTMDGVHPNPYGHMLIALTWLKSMGFEL